jgi:hypothetical protein
MGTTEFGTQKGKPKFLCPWILTLLPGQQWQQLVRARLQELGAGLQSKKNRISS